MHENVYDLIKSEEQAYKQPIPIMGNYSWCMYDHIEKTVLYKNSQYLSGNSDDKPFKQIMLPILNLQYRAEDIDVKDIELYVNDEKAYYKTFLLRKFHDQWARKIGLDSFIDDLIESYVDFGGTLINDIDEARPRVVPLETIAFCDQSGILNGPIGLKDSYAPDQLLAMKDAHWGDAKYGATTTLENLIEKATTSKTTPQANGQQVKTPGKNIEVYLVEGSMPKAWLNRPQVEGAAEDKSYVLQMQIVSFYMDDKGDKQYVTLFAGPEDRRPFKVIKRDKIFGRALGRGGGEELFEPQVWTNSSAIHINDMLSAASKVILKTSDPTLVAKHPSGLKDLDNLEIVEVANGEMFEQLNTQPVNLPLFEKSIDDWNANAQLLGGATDAVLGESPAAGTPFQLQQLIVQQGTGLHDWRRGQIATFLDEVYRDWILPYFASEVTKEQKFLAELSLDEMQSLADAVSQNLTSKFFTAQVLNGKSIPPGAQEAYKQTVRDSFMKGGNKRFLKILDGEMQDAPIDVFVNIAGKEKDLDKLTDKLVNIFRQVIANPSILSMPPMAKLFNEILEASGLSPLDFSGMEKPGAFPAPTPSPIQPQQGQQPQQVQAAGQA